jgi:hypothetical protein
LYKDTYGICTAVPLLAWWLWTNHKRLNS